MPDISVSSSLGALDATVELATTDTAVASLDVKGTWVGTLVLEATNTGDWADAYTPNVFFAGGGAASGTLTANGRRRIDTGGAAKIRARLNPYTSGAAVVNLRVGSGSLGFGGGGVGGFLSTGGGAPASPTAVFTRPANATPYTVGDEVGTAGTAPTTVSVARVNGGSGVILGAQAVYSNYPATVPSLVLLIFSATVTLAGDNAQLALSDADAAKLVAVIPLTASQALNYSAGAPVSSGALVLNGSPSRPAPHFVCGGSEQTLYCCLITLNAFTPIANSEQISVYVDVEQN